LHMKLNFLRCGILVLTLFVLITGCSHEPTQLTIGLIPSNNSESLEKSFEPIRVHLEKEMGVSIKVIVPTDYLGLIDAMKNKKVDIGWFGAFSYIAAENEMSLEPMVIQYRTGLGITYHSLIITRKDSGIKTIDQLQGRSFAFVDRGSTSGFVIPYSLFKSRNMEYSSYLGEIKYAGSHDAVLTSVLTKQADAGAMEDVTLRRMIEEGSVNAEDIHVIWQSSDIPGSPFISRSDLHPKVKDKFRNTMISLHEKDQMAMKSFDNKIEKYVEFDNSLYNEIRNISNILGKDFIIENFMKKK
jgi:phosphonate transport system substrate-binding protein